MPMELRKRKAPEPTVPAPVVAKKKTPAKGAKTSEKVAKAAAKVVKEASPEAEKVDEEKPLENGDKEEVDEVKETKNKAGNVEVGDVIDLEGFGGEIESNDGEKTTLKSLVDASGSGVVLFTYPKASTPGCTKQVCFFRDAYEPLTAGGLTIFGLSTDSPKANTTFKDKQKLPYPLLCDPKATLIEAIGLKKSPKGTQRGVFVVDKKGKVLVAEAGSPQGTLDRVQTLVDELAK